MERFKFLILSSITTKDNTTIDMGRILWLVFSILFIFLEIHSIFKTNTPFNEMNFAQAVALLLAGGGICLGAKSNSEPDKRQGDIQ